MKNAWITPIRGKPDWCGASGQAQRTPSDGGELVESQLIPCETCGAGVALLIFAPGATDLGRFEDDARRMHKHVQEMDVPTYVIGPELGDGPMQDRPADILKIWPEREPMQRLRPDAFNPLLEGLAQTHCGSGSVRHELEQMSASDELHYQGTRWHRGSLCPKCVFYRRVSDKDEACDSYEKCIAIISSRVECVG